MVKKHTATRQRHIAQRTCVVCRSKADKRDLTRLVSTDSGVELDPGGKMNGRGAYICQNRDCWERAVNTNILNQALRTTLKREDRERIHRAIPSP